MKPSASNCVTTRKINRGYENVKCRYLKGYENSKVQGNQKQAPRVGNFLDFLMKHHGM